MYKIGQKIVIRDKQYEVQHAANSNISCRLCQEHNPELPCCPAGQVNDTEWNRKICLANIPANAYLKPKETIG